MTEKRFKCVCMAEDLVEFQDNGIYKCFNDVDLEKLLNSLYEENKELQKERDYYEKRHCEKHNKWNNACLDNIQLKQGIKGLREENQRLKKAEILANHRGEMIGFATALIEELGSQEMREMWERFREKKYEEWRKL